MSPSTHRRIPAAVVLALCASISLVRASEDFPEPVEIRANVEFWVRVFSEWSEREIVVHDMEHPGLQYQVVALPGEAEPIYTDEQRDFVDGVRQNWEEWLAAFEDKVERGDPLDESEQQWLSHIDATVGRPALSGAHERVRTQRGLRERFLAGLERSTRYLPAIRKVFREAGLPEDLGYLPHVESSFVANARSSASAVGLWQFTRGTGKLFLKITAATDERLDPITATHAAAAYLRKAKERLESWPLALTSYNHGVEGMARAKNQFGTDFGSIYERYESRSFGFASRNFYAEFLAVRRIASEPEKYFPEGWQSEPPFDSERLVLAQPRTATAIAGAYGLDLTSLATRNPAWTKETIHRSASLPAGATVWLPPGARERSFVATATAAAVPAGGSATYVVRTGDTLSEIARRHGMSVTELRERNGMAQGSSLVRIGQELVVGGAANARTAVAEVHVVRRGETLIEIASRYGVKLMDLLHANSLTASHVIHPGQRIQIPTR